MITYKKMTSVALSLGIVLSAGCWGTAALADENVLMPAQFDLSVYKGGFYGYVDRSGTLGGPFEDFPTTSYGFSATDADTKVSGSAGVALLPQPVVQAAASAGDASLGGGAAATLEYYYDISGPDDYDRIPITISGKYYFKGTVQGKDDNSATLSLYAELANDATSVLYKRYDGNCAASSCTSTAGDNFSVTLMITPNSDHDIYMDVGGVVGGIGSMSLLLDPTITIDPTFLAENPGYSIAFSDGVGNGAGAVPEPATWAMMIGGIGIMGGALRRCRTAVRTTIRFA